MPTATFVPGKQESTQTNFGKETDRRDWIRYPSDLDAICWIPGEESREPWGAVVRDISGGGAGLISRERLEIGQEIRLKLHSHYVNLSEAMDAKVVAVKVLNAAEYLIGCQFLRQLDVNERRHLL